MGIILILILNPSVLIALFCAKPLQCAAAQRFSS
jgi:hypothetical protein